MGFVPQPCSLVFLTSFPRCCPQERPWCPGTQTPGTSDARAGPQGQRGREATSTSPEGTIKPFHHSPKEGQNTENLGIAVLAVCLPSLGRFSPCIQRPG